MEWLARLYAKRIVNVNVNILAAGAMAIGIMYAVMHWIHVLEIDAHIASKTKIKVEFVNMGLSFVIDLVADLAVYYVLHWYANHVPSRYGGKLLHPEYSDLSFMQDATKVQVERMLLAPILYLIAMGLQYYLQREGVRPPAAAAIGFTVGICTTRALHTLFMLWDQRRRRRLVLAQGTGAGVSQEKSGARPGTETPKAVKQAS